MYTYSAHGREWNEMELYNEWSKFKQSLIFPNVTTITDLGGEVGEDTRCVNIRIPGRT